MEHTRPKRLIRLPAVEARTGFKKAYVQELAKKGHFPAPVPLGRRAIAWVEAEVDEWIEERIRARKIRDHGVGCA